MKMMDEKINELGQRLKKGPLIWNNPSGKGMSTVLRTTENSIVYQRGNSLLYFSKAVAIDTFSDLTGKIHARELKNIMKHTGKKDVIVPFLCC